MTWERMPWLKNQLVLEEVSRCKVEGTDRLRKRPDILVRLKSNPTEILRGSCHSSGYTNLLDNKTRINLKSHAILQDSIYVPVIYKGVPKMYTHFKRCYLCITFGS
jgi:hypothetical protein